MADQAAPARVAGLPVGVVPGGLGNRFVAYLIDNVVPVLVTLLAGVLVVQTNASPAVVGGIALRSGARLDRAGLVDVRHESGGPRDATDAPATGRARQRSADRVDSVPDPPAHSVRARQHRNRAAVDGDLSRPATAPAGLARSRGELGGDQGAAADPAAPGPGGEQFVRRARSNSTAGSAAPDSTPSASTSGSTSGGAAPTADRRSGAQPRRLSPVVPGAERRRPPPPLAEPAATDPPAGAGTGWRAVLDDGREISIDGLVLLGRNPQPRPGEEQAALIKIADTTRTVSKSHLEIGRRGSGLYVVDRGSTNGSTVTGTSGVSQRCAPGEPVSVESGSIVSFGDHWLEIRFS